jgi:hypothetical protein
VVNRTCGYNAGNVLLNHVAEAAEASIREHAAKEQILALEFEG